MNRDLDFDQALRDWLDEGSDHAPERFIWAALEDVERSAQRGAWRVSLEERLVNMKPVALVLVTAAVIVAALAGYQLIAGPNVGNPGPTPTPLPPASFSAADLPSQKNDAEWASSALPCCTAPSASNAGTSSPAA